MKTLLQPDGRWLAPWDEAAARLRPGAVAKVTGEPPVKQNVTGLSGWNPKAGARVTVSGGAQG